ncbi:hypothetical protein OR263_10270 [Streptomyces sp. NEAU-H22]|uniref:hypothetical protein n=1 Tax=Streptomyces sp. NEAU-H22 TaxID=2994655 RepID=UPI00225C3D38|nr:hypothetical protein [Streptomyces sp. NEAU-H22]MCX3287092.1 hypothetical protein [Streptomyces sp. NEAU-H22]
MSHSDLPADIDEFMDFIGMNIAASGGFVWNERDRIKSDMMLVRHRWSPSRVPSEALRNKCRAIGMTVKDADEVVDWLRKTQSGRRLRPNHIKNFRWHQDPTP